MNKKPIQHALLRGLHVVLASMTLSGSAMGQGRSGGPYSMTEEVLSAAGVSVTTSSTYRVQSGCTAETAGGQATSSHYTLKHGFAGMNADRATGFSVSANTNSLDEGQTAQASVHVVLDDSTTALVSPSKVIWNSLASVLTVGPDGVVLASPFYDDTFASISAHLDGTTQFLQFQINDVDYDNYPPYANDRMPDDWQVEKFGSNGTDAGPMDNPDDDAFPNVYEYLYDLHPLSNTLWRVSAYVDDPDFVVAYRKRKVLRLWDLRPERGHSLRHVRWAPTGIVTRVTADRGSYYDMEARIPFGTNRVGYCRLQALPE